MQDDSPSKGLRDRTKLKRTQKVGTQASSILTQQNKSDDEDFEEKKKPAERPKRAAKKETLRPQSRHETDQDPVSHDEDFDPNASDGQDEIPNIEDEMLLNGDENEDDLLPITESKPKRSRKKKEGVKTEDGAESQSEEADDSDDNVFIDNLPKDEIRIKQLLK